ncbi:MAG: hypothetical protein ABIG29_00600 [Candidatus Nealsonbacteria bacterium]
MQQEKGQIAIIVFGLVLIGALLALNFTGVLGGKKDSSKKEPAAQGEEALPIVSSVGPQRSGLYPTGTLPSGTKETIISVSTDVAAYCRYDKDPDTAYNSMSGSFTYNKEKTFHSIKVTGLETGTNYTYYIRCRDMDSVKNIDDAVVRFNVGSTSLPGGSSGGSSGGSVGLKEIPPIISNLYPTGTLPAGTSETQLSVSTNEAAYCRYSTIAGTSYNSMSKSFSYDNAKLAHTVNVVGLIDNKIYEYFVRCRDMNSNANTSDVVIKFGVGGVSYLPSSPQNQDITPPYRYKGYPDDDMPYSTKNVQITLQTDEKAVCRYDTVSGVSYGQMKIFDSTNNLLHSTEASGFNEGETYKYYIKCADERNNINTDDYLISFKVEAPEDVAPPIITVLYPYDDLYYGTTEVQLGIQTNESASCKYGTEQGVAYSSMKKSFTKQSANLHTAKVTGLQNGVDYSFFVRCKDTAGNANTGDIMINFRVTP